MRGVRIFTRSNACLQLYTDRKLRKLDDVRFREGAAGLVAHVDILREEIAAEWKELEIQAAIDEANLLDPAALTFYDTLVETDKQWPALVGAVERWFVGRIGAVRHSVEGAAGIFKYEPLASWAGTVGAADLIKPAFWRSLASDRKFVRRFADVDLLRAGSAAFEACWATLAVDDRGMTYLRWCPPTPDEDVCSALSYAHACHLLIEADRQGIQQVGEAAKLNKGVIDTSIRLADALLPPWTEIVYFDENLQIISDSVLESLLSREEDSGWECETDEAPAALVDAARVSAVFGIGNSKLLLAARAHILATLRCRYAIKTAEEQAAALPSDLALREALRAAVAAPSIRLEVYGLLIPRGGGASVNVDGPIAWPTSANLNKGLAWSAQPQREEEQPRQPPVLKRTRRIERRASQARPSASEKLQLAVPTGPDKPAVDLSLGSELRRRRAERGTSQTALEKATGLRHGTIFVIEKGKRGPSDSEWSVLDAALAILPCLNGGE